MSNRFSNAINTFKKNYFEFRTWRLLIKNMKKNLPEKGEIEFQGTRPYLNKPGIAFSFDDSFRIEHWYKYGKDLFGFYDVKVTFNINGFHHYEGKRAHTQKEIDMLLELQADGHEIAHHGFKHRNVSKHTKEVGITNWLKDDIISLFRWAEEQSHSKTQERFRQPVSFALPFSEYEAEHIAALVPQYYKLVRGNLNKGNLTDFNCTGFAPSICIDSVYLSNVRYINKLMKMAKKTGSNLIFMGHSILPDDVKWEEFGWEDDRSGVDWWRISPNTISKIIQLARKNNMEFYTTAELAGTATFIDRNFEKAVRSHLANPTDKWISIDELSSIKKLDLSNYNIKNLDGIQYFINLETLNLRNNQISDFRLLTKLSGLKEIRCDKNLVDEIKLFGS